MHADEYKTRCNGCNPDGFHHGWRPQGRYASTEPEQSQQQRQFAGENRNPTSHKPCQSGAPQNVPVVSRQVRAGRHAVTPLPIAAANMSSVSAASGGPSMVRTKRSSGAAIVKFKNPQH